MQSGVPMAQAVPMPPPAFGAPPMPPPSGPTIDIDAMTRFLKSKGFPSGLIQAVAKSCAMFPLRFFIVDDSGSMAMGDGHRLIGSGNSTKLIECSRWSELTDSLKFHATLAEYARAPTEFRLLNGAEPIVVGRGDDNGFAMSVLQERFNGSPNGGTPLCRHIREVTAQIQSAEAVLRANNQKACIVIATDGESSDGDIALAMKPLERLPCWVVIRLCTDDDRIVDYWNNIDSQLELDMDVLDDFTSEAAEIMAVNNWIVYGEPLHKLREWGIHFKELDLLDEASLTSDQMKFAVALVCMDMAASELPHPVEDWRGFSERLTKANDSLGLVWNPIERKLTKWIRMTRLSRKYNPSHSSCAIM